MNYSTNIPEYGVSQFNSAIRELISNNFNYVRIKGEISEVKTAAKGQLYITLKDTESIISGVIWDQKKRYLELLPETGMEVIVTGKITTWSKFKTTYQIDIDKLEISGEGALLKLIEDRKKRLKEKGYFDNNNKKSIPFLPNKIGVITSPVGSVIYDIINRITERFIVPIDIWPVSVQGIESVESIIKAIKGFNSMHKNEKPCTIIIARGGGSTEDLMVFNDENLALAVYESKIPIISAIGHETDTTIIDYVSDLRASTPTAAAEKSVPLKLELIQNIKNIDKRITFLIANIFNNKKDCLDGLIKFLKVPNKIVEVFKNKLNQIVKNLDNFTQNKINENNLLLSNLSRTLNSPDSKIKLNKSVLKNLSKNLNININNISSFHKINFEKLNRLLYSNSINSNLNKGYSVLTKNNKIIKSSKQIKDQDSISAKLADKSIDLIIKKIN